ncbi:hypothetical protein C7974DRAFT_423341 [Boeremia exigua]|uniref:uncharacterized protein n=1 Tax=Boeremia exigua TaxID=749465 RepID=UPI001E8DC27F|nr:uncharacterized protein C7974DRAFT_423341 [Boeremia exigua]KAH6638486.1 hypothetical protein C7974DRAFT_423341 [Boeremia exigua]
MRAPSPLLLLLFRTAYLYTMIIYAACAFLGFPGALFGVAAALLLATPKSSASLSENRD